MKLVIVRKEDYDCHTVGVAHPVEAQSKESVILEFENKKKEEFDKLKEKYPSENEFWHTRYSSFYLCGLFITIDNYDDGYNPEIYTVEEWFDKYKDKDFYGTDS